MPAMVDAPPARTLKPLLMLVGATVFWGVSFPVIKALLLLNARLEPGGLPWFTTFYVIAPRFVLSAAILLLWLGRKGGGIAPREWQQGVFIGLFAGAGMLFQNDGLNWTAASTSAFLTQFYAILIPVWLALRGRRNPGGWVWLCCLLVLAGVALLGHFDWRALRFGRGEWETLLCSFFFMGQILWVGKGEFSGNRPMQVTLVTFATQALLFSALALATAPSGAALLLPWTSGAWLGLTAVLTLFCTVGAYCLMTAWQPKISATEAGLIYCVEPIFGSVFALFLPAWFSGWAGIAYANEQATFSLLVGGSLITLANLLLQLRPPV